LIILSEQQLKNQLREQLGALCFFASEFDKGKRFLFREMAVKLRVLFHNTNGKTRSLLSQLNMENVLLFDSATLIHSEATNGIKAPVHFRFNVDVPLIFQPRLLPGMFKSNYNDWWESGAIIIDKNGKEYTRKEVVRYVTDNDGGAHVDSSLPDYYHALSRGDASGWSQKLPDGGERNIDPVPAIIREITHEVLETLLWKEYHANRLPYPHH